jgi:hypothetical protein
MRSLNAVVLALALALGCSSTPPPAASPWSDAEPVVAPEPPPPPPPPESPRGRLLVHTERRPGKASMKGSTETHGSFRGYSVFDEKGALWFTCPGHLPENDTRWLPPGRYVAVATLKSGMFETQTHERRIQFVIVADRTTIIDFSTVPDQPPRS